jgi:RNA polymerase sigma-70 factor (ECF subfamily)
MAGDLSRLFDECAPVVFSFAARRVGRDLAHDVTAETFRIAVESAAGYDPQRGPRRAWLLGIAANLIRRYWRTERRRLAALVRLPVEGVDEDDLASAERRIDAEHRLRRLLGAVADLPADDRDLLTLVAWERLSYRDAGAALGIAPGTVGSRLNRIRALLAEDGSDDR